jgi:heme/copper-type cytochrome/quinol oxidase subunit 4
MSYLYEVINILRSQSVFEILLPFLLTFSIFYGAIRKMKIFGETKTANKISIIISLVAALYVTIYTPVGINMGEYFSRFFAISSMWMVGIIVFLMIFGLFFFLNPDEMKSKFMGNLRTVAIISIIIVVATWLLSGGLNLFTNSRIPFFNKDDLVLILILVGVGLVIFFVSREDDGDGNKKPKPLVLPSG